MFKNIDLAILLVFGDAVQFYFINSCKFVVEKNFNEGSLWNEFFYKAPGIKKSLSRRPFT